MPSSLVTLATILALSAATYGNAIRHAAAREVSTAVANFGYVGCYTEPSSVRALVGSVYYDNAMTLEKCASYCSPFTYFGVEYGRECWCAQSLNAGSLAAPETQCSMACGGNAAELCGAGNRLNVYEAKTAPTTTSSASATSTTWAILGCYTEAASGRALDEANFTNSTTMTVENCQAVCNQYTYIGVEYGSECYCGNSITGGSVPAPDADCNFTCAGNKAELCGSGSRLNLYVNIFAPAITTTWGVCTASATPTSA